MGLHYLRMNTATGSRRRVDGSVPKETTMNASDRVSTTVDKILLSLTVLVMKYMREPF